MQILIDGQANAEVPVNENFETVGWAAVFGKRHDATEGLTWGYEGGRWGGLAITEGTVTLSNSTTNYLVVARATGALTASTTSTNWNDLANYARVYKLTTAGGVVTATEDHRAGFGGVHGQLPPAAAAVVASAANIALPLGVEAVEISGTTGITSITATGHAGRRVTLIFQGALTVTDGSNLKLAGSFTSTADDTLTLACNGTNWYEVARATN